jgi:hypothetical protein
MLDSLPPLRDDPIQAIWSADMDVGGWLRGLGLGEYENKFRNNRIDAEVLSQLTADDLRTLASPRSATDESSSQPSLHWPGQRLQQSSSLTKQVSAAHRSPCLG